jgi:hypothetical protein
MSANNDEVDSETESHNKHDWEDEQEWDQDEPQEEKHEYPEGKCTSSVLL